MAENIEIINALARQFASLDGVGHKSALRMAYAVVAKSKEDVDLLVQTVLEAKQVVHFCPICQNFTDKDVCSICSDVQRDEKVICVVNDSKMISAIEKVREFHGLYHVLHGLISPMKGTMPEHLKLKELVTRVAQGNVGEVIVATAPTVEGEATALYIAKILKPFGVKVTRPATGIPVGADLEYADAVTLSRAMEGRKELL